jgi:hypothetical protein
MELYQAEDGTFAEARELFGQRFGIPGKHTHWALVGYFYFAHEPFDRPKG